MRVLFTCGGTGGHIYPAIAVAKLLRERKPDCEILFVGAENGMENRLVPREGFALETLRISSFQRQLTPKALVHNAQTAYFVETALRKADGIISRFQPDVIVGTGGYASFPALRVGAKRKIPTAVHESNAVPGLTTRMVQKTADAIMVSFSESVCRYDAPERVIVTGTPVREEFIYTKKSDARKELGLDDRPLIVSYWGSLGAREMNKKIVDFFACEQNDGFPYRHIHACGSYGWQWMPQYLKEHGIKLEEQTAIDMREFIFDMPKLMAAADLVICRAGAATIAEVAASGTPCIMVPSPNVTEHHQEKNARVLESRGAAKVICEEQCSGKILYETAKTILNDKALSEQMRSNVRKIAVVDATERIYDTILKISRTQ